MAALPSPSQVAGTHIGIYEAYYQHVDPNGTGVVQAPEAARFLKKSKLSDVVLSKIWDLSDPTGKGYLDKGGVFVALKLVALAQAGRELPPPAALPAAPAPPPDLGEVPSVCAGGVGVGGAGGGSWAMSGAERERYARLFASLSPSANVGSGATGVALPGDTVKGVLLESRLPVDTLGRIWDLADQDRDGALDLHEFCVAMHLVYKALEKRAVPTTLPAELRRAAPPPPRPPRPASPHVPAPAPAPALLDLSSPTSSEDWCAGVSSSELSAWGAQWATAACGGTRAAGPALRPLLAATGAPPSALAAAWAAADTDGAGALTREQFLRAMCLARRAAPATTTSDTQEWCGSGAGEGGSGISLGPQPSAALEALAREVEALAGERAALARDVADKQRRLHEDTAAADALQSEYSTLSATLKQLEAQRGEAARRLAEMAEMAARLRTQAAAAADAAGECAAAVAARRAAAAGARAREAALRQELAAAAAAADDLTAQTSRHVLSLSQARLKVEHLEEHLGAVTAATAALTTGGADAAAALALQPQFGAAALDRLVRGVTPATHDEGAVNGFDADPFPDGPTADPFAPPPHSHQVTGGGGGADPFAADPFAPTPASASDSSSWQEDPFAVLHAPPPASAAAAPSPALPPKRHKAPPPRPAPPRHAKGSGGVGVSSSSSLEFTVDPFADYRYEDPYNIEDPFADVPRPSSAAGGTWGRAHATPADGRASAPPITAGNNNDEGWATWPATTASDWNGNANDAWPTSVAGAGAGGSVPPPLPLPAPQKKGARMPSYARSLVHTLGSVGRSRRRPTAGHADGHAAVEDEAARRRREEAELQLALAISLRDQ